MTLADQLLQYLITGFSVGIVYGLVGLGITIVFNATGIINFAQGEFVMLGGMAAAALAANGAPLWLAVILAVAATTLVALAMERLTIYQLRGASVITLIIATIGASLVLQGGAKLLWGPDAVTLPPFSGDTPIRIGGGGIAPQRLWVMGLATLSVVAVQLFFRFTLTGKAIRACAINRRAARLSGISADRMVRLSFAVSAALAALGGAVLTPVTLMQYAQGTHYTLTGFLASVLGGLGNGLGAVLGGVTIGMIESFSSGFISSGYSKAIALVVALIVLWWRPQGLLGRRQLQ